MGGRSAEKVILTKFCHLFACALIVLESYSQLYSYLFYVIREGLYMGVGLGYI